MPVADLPQFVHHRLFFSGPGTTAASIGFHIGAYSNPVVPADVDAVNSLLAEWVNGDGATFTDADDLSGCYSEEWTCTHIEARDTNHEGIVLEASVNEPGRLVGAALPAQIALCVRELGALGGRARRGRVYLPGQAEVSSTDTGTVEPAHAARVGVAFDALTAALNGLSPVLDTWVVSYYLGVDVNGDPIPRVMPLTTIITGYVVNERWDTQRRRAGRT